MEKGTKIIRSAFGISCLNTDSSKCIDLPLDIIQELSVYMAYRDRNETTMSLLVG